MTSYSWCATPNIGPGNTTLEVMSHCCPTLEIYNVDGCAWCYTSFIDADTNSETTSQFSDCISRNAKEINVTTQRISHCNTPNMKSIAATKELSVWKVGVLAVLLGALSWSL
jgi:hypothetical protein